MAGSRGGATERARRVPRPSPRVRLAVVAAAVVVTAVAIAVLSARGFWSLARGVALGVLIGALVALIRFRPRAALRWAVVVTGLLAAAALVVIAVLLSTGDEDDPPTGIGPDRRAAVRYAGTASWRHGIWRIEDRITIHPSLTAHPELRSGVDRTLTDALADLAGAPDDAARATATPDDDLRALVAAGRLDVSTVAAELGIDARVVDCVARGCADEELRSGGLRWQYLQAGLAEERWSATPGPDGAVVLARERSALAARPVLRPAATTIDVPEVVVRDSLRLVPAAGSTFALVAPRKMVVATYPEATGVVDRLADDEEETTVAVTGETELRSVLLPWILRSGIGHSAYRLGQGQLLPLVFGALVVALLVLVRDRILLAVGDRLRRRPGRRPAD
ncbi:hypothetical protein [Cryptosporangium minutisporangium]|uniref:Uncharacterized protein n=1 Tax=Cryptosporangium minutisporangium TaxID=113569 RepID=A0ABP6SQH2_9ACTN